MSFYKISQKNVIIFILFYIFILKTSLTINKNNI